MPTRVYSRNKYLSSSNSFKLKNKPHKLTELSSFSSIALSKKAHYCSFTSLERKSNEMKMLLISATLIATLISTTIASALNPLLCPTAQQLAKLKVAGQSAPKLLYSSPGFTKPNQCSVALFIVAPKQALAQAILRKAVLFRSEPNKDTTMCFYDKIPSIEKIGLITVMTYRPKNGSCTVTSPVSLTASQLPKALFTHSK